MAKGARSTLQVSQEPVLFGLALAFLKHNNGISREEFPGKFIDHLTELGLLLSDDLKTSDELGQSRGSELAVEVRVRNLYSSHGRLFSTGQVEEKSGCFYLKGGNTNQAKTSPKQPTFVSLRSPEMENVIFYGPPGTGKTFKAKRQNPGTKPTIIQFHPSYSYEHFVQGERLVSIGKDRTTQVVDGPLMICYRRATNTPVKSKACIRKSGDDKTVQLFLPTGLLAKYDIRDEEDLLISFEEGEDSFFHPIQASSSTVKVPSEKVPADLTFTDGDIIEVQFKCEDWVNKHTQVLIIDEINRADAARVFGELMNALADIDDTTNAQCVVLQYSGEEFRWPENLRIVGTMNSADRSIGEIDQAMKRRFKIIECPPEPEVLSDVSLPKIKHCVEAITNSLDMNKLSKLLGKNLVLDKNSCDQIINFYNLFCAVSESDSKMIPIPSVSLRNLHSALEKNQDGIFGLKRKLIGHSFHMELSQRIAELLMDLTNSGDLSIKGISEKAISEVYSYYDAFVLQEIRPQLASICLENDNLVDTVVTSWKTLDKAKLDESHERVNDKAAKS